MGSLVYSAALLQRLLSDKLSATVLDGGAKLTVAQVDDNPLTEMLHPVVLGRMERDIALVRARARVCVCVCVCVCVGVRACVPTCCVQALQLAIQLDAEMSVRVEANVTAQLSKTDGTPEQQLRCLVRYLQRVHLYAYW